MNKTLFLLHTLQDMWPAKKSSQDSELVNTLEIQECSNEKKIDGKNVDRIT